MQGRHRSIHKIPNERVVQNIDVKVQNIEPVGHAANPVEHHDVMSDGLPDVGIKPQGGPASGLQAGGGQRVPAGEQCHVVPLPDQFLGQIGHDPFGPAIKPRRTTFEQRSNLRYLHEEPHLQCGQPTSAGHPVNAERARIVPRQSGALSDNDYVSKLRA